MQDSKLCLINVYCPVEEERKKIPFIENLLGYLPGNTPLILGGDFNFVENIQLDKIGGNQRKETSVIETFHEFKNIAGIRDLTEYSTREELTPRTQIEVQVRSKQDLIDFTSLMPLQRCN
jgi:hypothetical protein